MTLTTVHTFVLLGLFMFGVLFNAFVTWLGERKRGQTALLVVAGVAVTLLGVAVVDWQAAMWAALCFVASGSPMVFGEWWRNVVARGEEAAAAREEARRAIEAARATLGSVSIETQGDGNDGA